MKDGTALQEDMKGKHTVVIGRSDTKVLVPFRVRL